MGSHVTGLLMFFLNQHRLWVVLPERPRDMTTLNTLNLWTLFIIIIIIIKDYYYYYCYVLKN